MKVPTIKVVTTQPLNYLTIKLLSFFVVAEGHGGSFDSHNFFRLKVFTNHIRNIEF